MTFYLLESQNVFEGETLRRCYTGDLRAKNAAMQLLGKRAKCKEDRVRVYREETGDKPPVYIGSAAFTPSGLLTSWVNPD